MTPEQIKEGRRLLEAAATAPWEVAKQNYCDGYHSEPQEGDGEGGCSVVAASGEYVTSSTHGEYWDTPLADGRAIVWLRNHAAELLDAAERVDMLASKLVESWERASAAERERDELRAEVERLQTATDEKLTRVFAAWLFDRAEQYNNGSGIRAAFDELISAVKAGEVFDAYKHGELNDLLREGKP